MAVIKSAFAVDLQGFNIGKASALSAAVPTADVVLVYSTRNTGLSVTAIPGVGGTMKIFRSTSPVASIEADITDGSLTSANLAAGTQPTLSRWMLWAAGAVSAVANEAPALSAGDIAICAIAVTAAGTVEVSQ